MFDFDTGHSGSEGPWINWSALGSHDGVVAPRTFVLRTGAERETFTAFERGVVFDIFKMKSGWQFTEGTAGVAPKWLWGEKTNQLPPSPGEGWKKGISLPCAIGGGKVATWEQAGAATWNSFGALVDPIRAGLAANPGKLPKVRQTGVRSEKYNKGGTTMPVFEIIEWVPRPPCLDAETAPAATSAGDPNATVQKGGLRHDATPPAASRPSDESEF